MYSKEEELEIYKKALIDWERPVEEALESKTYSGFCTYFAVLFRHNGSNFHRFLPALWKQGINNSKKADFLHYSTAGKEQIGREERVSALKSAIKELEEEAQRKIMSVFEYEGSW